MERVALIDVCDVCVDLHESTVRLAHLSVPDEPSEWDIFKLISEDDARRVKALYDDAEFWRSLPPVAGVHEGIEALRRQGCRVHFLTSPWYTCERWESVRRAWLAENFPWFHPLDMTVTSEKYRFRGDILIDDRPKHVETWQRAHPEARAWLFDMRFNRYFGWPVRGMWSSDGITAVLR